MLKTVKKIAALGFAALIGLTPTIAMASTDIYHVQEDDTLWIISRKYKVGLEEVIQANPQFPDPDLIYPGDAVYVPLETNGLIGASMADAGDGKVKNNPRVGFNTMQGVGSKAGSNATEAAIASLVNQERAKNGLSALSLAADVSNVARIKSEDMRDQGYFNHNSPRYGSPFDMLKQFGIKYKTAGENIAKGQKTAEAVMKAWMNSEGHRKNILNPNYKEIGVGYVTSSNGTTYWTQQFVSR